YQSIAKAGHCQAAPHDEGEGGIPGSEHVQEALYFRRVGHPGNGHADAEQNAGNQRRKILSHDVQPQLDSRRRMATVAIPLAMNVRVARIERMERRDIPQMPWP